MKSVIAVCLFVQFVTSTLAGWVFGPVTFDAIPDPLDPARWTISYSFDPTGFAEDEGIAIRFDESLFDELVDVSAGATDWDLLVLQPDPNLPDAGYFDFLALRDDPRLPPGGLTVGATWLGASDRVPDVQPFEFYRLNPDGSLVILESGMTDAAAAVIPEPSGLIGLVALLIFIGLVFRRSKRRWVVGACVGLWGLNLGVSPSLEAAPLSHLSVSNLELVSSRRVTRTVSEFVYTVHVDNAGGAVTGVTGMATARGSFTTVVDGEILLGDLDAGSSGSAVADLVIQVDRRLRFKPTVLSWAFDGTPVGTSSPPSLSGLSAPARIGPDEIASLVFDYNDPDDDLDYLEIVEINPLETRTHRIPAGMLGLMSSGRASFPLDGADLPLGVTQARLTLVDLAGQRSATSMVSVEVGAVPDPALAAPSIDPGFLNPTSALWDRPTGVFDENTPQIAFFVTDPDAQLARFRIQFSGPGTGTESIDVPAGRPLASYAGLDQYAVLPFRFHNDSALGSYHVVITPLDAAGRSGGSLDFTGTLAASSSGFTTVVLSGFNPTAGEPGAVVTLQGQRFNYVSEVYYNDLPLDFNLISPTQLQVTLPSNAPSAAFVLNTTQGQRIVSATRFRVREQVRLSLREPIPLGEDGLPIADLPSVFAGGQIQFQAVAIAEPGRDLVEWSVDGIPGGDATVGTIDANGLFTAPVAPPAAGRVAIGAQLVGLADTMDTMALIVRPLESISGTATADPNGLTTVLSADLRSAIEVPAGAVPIATTVSVRSLEPGEFPPPPLGEAILGGVQLGPDGFVFTNPIQAYLPLSSPRTPGATLTVRLVSPDGTTFVVGEDRLGRVDESGLRVGVSLPHFSTWTVHEAIAGSSVALPPPVVDTISASVIEEGDLVPLRMTGSGLSADLRVEIIDASTGLAVSDVGVEGWVGNDAEAGVLLRSLPDALIGLGDHRDYLLRLTNGLGASTDVPLRVNGLPEFTLTSSTPLVLDSPAPGRFSSITVGPAAEIRLRGGELNWTATGPVRIDGRILADGQDGNDGSGRLGGAAGREGGAGGNGRTRGQRQLDLGLFDVKIEELIDPDNLGLPGNLTSTTGHLIDYRGLGGDAGKSVVFAPLEIIEEIVACVAAPGIGCVAIGGAVIDLVNGIDGFQSGDMYGQQGLAAVQGPFPVGVDTTGGGGGGGGGHVRVDVSYAGFGGAVEFFGGGGGAGGDGGRNVSIRTRDTLSVAGEVTTRGGDGGDGSATSEMSVRVKAFVSADAGTYPGSAAFRGGGGGGGHGGRLQLTGRNGVEQRGTITARGGSAGEGGYAYIVPELGSFIPARDVMRRVDAESGGRIVREPRVDPTTLRTMVTDRYVLPVRLRVPYAYGSTADFRLAIYDDAGTRREQIFPYDPSAGLVLNTYVQLYPGYNYIGSNDAYAPVVLTIANDADGDGLSDADEAAFGTDPAVGDTDGDGLSDLVEVLGGFNPLRADSDGDGLNDGDEVGRGTDPTNPDTDGDGFLDSIEVFLASDPLESASTPAGLPEGTIVGNSAAVGPAYATAFDLTTGTPALLGQPAGGLGFGITFDELGWAYIAEGNRLALQDVLSGETYDVGAFSGGVQIALLAYDSASKATVGVELGGAPDFQPTGQLFAVDVTDASVTPLGSVHATRFLGIAFDVNGRLFAVRENANSGAANELVELDPTNGSILAVVGSTGLDRVGGLTFARDGRLIASRVLSAESSEFHILDTSTGGSSFLSTTPRAVFDLATSPWPLFTYSDVPDIAYPFSQFGLVHDSLPIDFDGDGHLDLLMTGGYYDPSNPRAASVFYVHFGDGAGNFSLGVAFHGQGNGLDSPHFVVAADIDGNGFLDLIGPNNTTFADDSQPGGLLVVRQTAARTFAPAEVIANGLTGHFEPLAVVAGQFNPSVDNFVDLVVCDGDRWSLLRNDGTGTFTISHPGELSGAAMVVGGDFDGDGWTDLATPSGWAPSRGDGTFGPAVGLPFLDGYWVYAINSSSLYAADFNADGFSDLAGLIDPGTGREPSIQFNTGGGGFVPVSTPPMLPGPWAYDYANVVGDFNGDGAADLLVGYIEFGYYIGGGHPSAPPRFQRIPRTISVRAPAVGDFDHDGLPDLISGDGFFRGQPPFGP